MDNRFLLLLLTLLGLTAGRVQAHGGGVAKIVNQPLGDYTVSVWLNPDPPAVGEMHVTVGLAQAEQPILDQQVTVQLVAADGDNATISALATHDNAASRFLYEADLIAPAAGDWRVVVSVADNDGQVAFETAVQPAADNRLPLWLAGFAAVGAIAAGAWWMVRREDA